MTFSGFDVLITSDKSLTYQQNLGKFSVTLLLLNIKANRYAYTQPLSDDLLQTLGSELTERFILIG